MFARLSSGLPPDAPFKPNLEELGYFINDNGDFRSIRDPPKPFHYYINRVGRWNDVNSEAMDTCMRAELLRRFESQGMIHFYLPQLTAIKPGGPSVPILATPPDRLRQKSRVLVILNEAVQDLGVWAWRALDDQGGMVVGTALGLIQELSEYKDHAPGLIIANPGQLLYSHKYGCALTYTTWNNLPRKSGAYPAPIVHPQHNLIPGNNTPKDHINFVFENVVFNSDLVAKDAEIYVVGLGTGADEAIQLFNAQWSKYSSRIAAMCLTSPSIRPGGITNSNFKSFLAQRARSWVSSAAPFNACITVPDSITDPVVDNSAPEISTDGDDQDQPWGDHGSPQEVNLCPTFSCGNEIVAESIFPRIYRNVLDWFFDEVATDVKTYKNPEFELYRFPENDYDCEDDGLTPQNGDNLASSGDGVAAGSPASTALDGSVSNTAAAAHGSDNPPLTSISELASEDIQAVGQEGSGWSQTESER